MEEPQGQVSNNSGFIENLRSSLFAKVMGLGVLCLLSLIPLSRVHSLLNERQHRHREASEEIARQWGGSQYVVGPFVSVPVSEEKRTSETYRDPETNAMRERKSVERFHVHVSPSEFTLQGTLNPEWRYRGIFRTPVYRGKVTVSGKWDIIDLDGMGREDIKLDWTQVKVLFKVADPTGIVSFAGIIDGEEREANPHLTPVHGEEWIALDLRNMESMPKSFQIQLDLRGANGFQFYPSGKAGDVVISSTWENPSFVGDLLPVERSVSESGFSGRWILSGFGRGDASVWMGKPEDLNEKRFTDKLSGVDLIDPLNGYTMVDRSLKYGMLFVAMGFGVFFLFETLCRLNLHPMQYLLAGLGNVLFFLLLLAISEVISFGIAYLIAGAASVLLISCYARAALSNGRRALVVGSTLSGFYLALYFILRQQDYAFIAGSGLLFASLAIVMYLTRNLDWSSGMRAGESKSLP